jgi:hypothetical protein
MATPKLPLKAQMNVRDHEKDLQSNLATITKATGKTFSVDADFPAIHHVISDNNKEKIGDIVYNRYMSAIAEG